MKLRHLLLFPLFVLPLSCSSGSEVLNATPLVLRSTEHHDVFIGDVIKVQPRTLQYQGESKVVDGQIITPSENTFTGHEFTVSEPGLYRVVYKAYFGFHEEIQEIEYLCKRKSEDFFDITNPVAISYGEYRHNTASYHHEGVLIDVKNGTEVKFNMPLSTEDFLTDQIPEPNKGYKDRTTGAVASSLIDFLVDPSTYMDIDFDLLTIRLTDSIDKSNYVDVIISDGYYAPDPRSGSTSYVRVGASCNWAMGWEWKSVQGKINQGDYHVGISGTGLSLSFRGQPYGDNGINSAQILYCSANSRFYNYRGSLETNLAYFVNELSDPLAYGNNTWNGFPSGKFYLSIIPSSFTNATGRLLIKSVGKYMLNSEVLTDNIAPEINVDLKGYDVYDLPRPVVGHNYPIFNSSVFDNYDSNLKAHVSVTYRDTVNKQDIDVAVVDNKFAVTRSGAYTINYSAKDRSGNVADVVSLRAITVDHVDDVNLQLESSATTVNSYTTISLPSVSDVTATGGTGNISITRKLIDPKGQQILLTSNSFKPTLVGDYALIFEGTDYIGNTGEVTYTIHSQALITPVFIDEINVPPVLIKGFKYSFDNIRAVETVNGENVIFAPTIKVNDEDYTGSVIATGTQLTVKYVATGHSNTSEISKTIDVVDVKDNDRLVQSRYFYGNLTAIENRDDITLQSSVDGETIFANRLNPDEFYLGMRILSGYNNASLIKILFTDVREQNTSVTFYLDLQDGTLQAPYLPEMSYTLYGDQFALYYNDSNQTFMDTNQNTLGSLIRDDNGHPFYGFPKGFYLSIGFVDVTGVTRYAIEKIANQVMGYKNYSGDRIKPTIKYSNPLPSEQFKGQVFSYPTFEAFDVLSDVTETSITVRFNGRVLVSGDQYCTESFTITESGFYSLIYTAKDSSNNQLRIVSSVSVYDDEAPTLEVEKLAKSSYSVGDGVKIPKYTANDDSGFYYVDVIAILPTNEMRILLHHTHDEEAEQKDVIDYMLDNEKGIYNPSFIINKTTFKVEMAGSYRLRFVAYDNAFNSTVVEYAFTAK